MNNIFNDNALYFTGTQLLEYGIIVRSYSTVRDLYDDFNRSTFRAFAREIEVRRFFKTAEKRHPELAQLNTAQFDIVRVMELRGRVRRDLARVLG